MSAPAINPEWGDDWMAIAEAVGITPRQHPETDVQFVPHTVHAEEFTNLALEITLGRWAAEVVDCMPIALLPTDHDVCCGCGDLLCGCLDQCKDDDGEDLPRDVCSHDGRAYCHRCSVHHCTYCKADVERWG